VCVLAVCVCVASSPVLQLMNKGGRIRHVDISFVCARPDFAGSRRGGAYRLSASRVSKGSRFSKTACRQCVCVLRSTYIMRNYKTCGFRFERFKRPLKPFMSPYTGKACFNQKIQTVESLFTFFLFLSVACVLSVRARVISLYYVWNVGLEKHRHHTSAALYVCSVFDVVLLGTVV